MAISFSVNCPECKNWHTVYVDEDSIPSMQDWYTFACPNANQHIAFPAGVATLDVQIPAGAIVATPADQ